MEEFGSYFMSKISKIWNELNDHPKYKPLSNNPPRFDCFKESTEEEVLKIINSMAAKTCGSDPIPSSLLKELAPHIIGHITAIVNESLRKGVVASKWKTSIIKPLLKKVGLDPIMKNYRPISNLPFMLKLVEKCMLAQFNKHCEDNLLMPDYQSAYRSNYSCETSLVKLVNDILWDFENQNAVALIALDLSAAFDTVDHDVLLDVLSPRFGVSGNAYNRFSSYLRSRNCLVEIEGSRSSERSLDFLVLQGSCGSLVLYSVYPSSLQTEILANVRLNAFADYHSLNYAFKANNREQEVETMNSLEQCLLDVNRWMNQNRLKMNTEKTEFIIFGSGQNLPKCSTKNINICGDMVEHSNKIRLLGMWLDTGLTFKHQISMKCCMAMFNLQKIRQIRLVLTMDACQTIVFGLVTSHLDYVNALYMGFPDCDLEKLQHVQNAVAKLVLNKSKYESATQALKELYWLSIKFRIFHKILTLGYKSLKGGAPKYLQELLHKQQPGRDGLRSSNEPAITLKVQRTKHKRFADRSFSVAGPKLWNNLPYNIRSADNLDSFKSKFKTHLFREAFN